MTHPDKSPEKGQRRMHLFGDICFVHFSQEEKVSKPWKRVSLAIVYHP